MASKLKDLDPEIDRLIQRSSQLAVMPVSELRKILAHHDIGERATRAEIMNVTGRHKKDALIRLILSWEF